MIYCTCMHMRPDPLYLAVCSVLFEQLSSGAKVISLHLCWSSHIYIASTHTTLYRQENKTSVHLNAFAFQYLCELVNAHLSICLLASDFINAMPIIKRARMFYRDALPSDFTAIDVRV